MKNNPEANILKAIIDQEERRLKSAIKANRNSAFKINSVMIKLKKLYIELLEGNKC